MRTINFDDAVVDQARLALVNAGRPDAGTVVVTRRNDICDAARQQLSVILTGPNQLATAVKERGLPSTFAQVRKQLFDDVSVWAVANL